MMVANPVDLNASLFVDHQRAVQKLSLLEERREADGITTEQIQAFAADIAHGTDAISFHLVNYGMPWKLRAFVDALVGLAGDRAASGKWFPASDEVIAERACATTKTISAWRKDYVEWAKRVNCGAIQIMSNYQDANGEWQPHSYAVHIALIAAETVLNASYSDAWTANPGVAKKETAKMMVDALPEENLYKPRKGTRRSDPQSRINQHLKFASTKIGKAIEALEGDKSGTLQASLTQIEEIEKKLAELKRKALGLAYNKEEEVEAKNPPPSDEARPAQLPSFSPENRGVVEKTSTSPDIAESTTYAKSNILEFNVERKVEGGSGSFVLVDGNESVLRYAAGDDVDELFATPGFARAYKDSLSPPSCVACGGPLVGKWLEIDAELCASCESRSSDVVLGGRTAQLIEEERLE